MALWSAHDLKVVSLILAHGRFLVRGSTLINPNRTGGI